MRTLTRTLFEQLNTDLFRSIQLSLENLMQRNARISRSSIDEIILIGGSTRIPKIRELVQQFFHGKQISIDCNIDEISSKFFMIP